MVLVAMTEVGSCGSSESEAEIAPNEMCGFSIDLYHFIHFNAKICTPLV